MTKPVAPASEAEALAQGYKPVPDPGSSIMQRFGLTLGEFGFPGQVNCNDPSNLNKLCRDKVAPDGTHWVGYCHADKNCHTLVKDP